MLKVVRVKPVGWKSASEECQPVTRWYWLMVFVRAEAVTWLPTVFLPWIPGSCPLWPPLSVLRLSGGRCPHCMALMRWAVWWISLPERMQTNGSLPSMQGWICRKATNGVTAASLISGAVVPLWMILSACRYAVAHNSVRAHRSHHWAIQQPRVFLIPRSHRIIILVHVLTGRRRSRMCSGLIWIPPGSVMITGMGNWGGWRGDMTGPCAMSETKFQLAMIILSPSEHGNRIWTGTRQKIKVVSSYAVYWSATNGGLPVSRGSLRNRTLSWIHYCLPLWENLIWLRWGASFRARPWKTELSLPAQVKLSGRKAGRYLLRMSGISRMHLRWLRAAAMNIMSNSGDTSVRVHIWSGMWQMPGRWKAVWPRDIRHPEWGSYIKGLVVCPGREKQIYLVTPTWSRKRASVMRLGCITITPPVWMPMSQVLWLTSPTRLSLIP